MLSGRQSRLVALFLAIILAAHSISTSGMYGSWSIFGFYVNVCSEVYKLSFTR